MQRLVRELRRRGGRFTVLSGAGISTESGIPDYRGPQGSYSRGHKPMTHAEFMRSDENRQRFWARSMFGWWRFQDVAPNAGHRAVAALEAADRVELVLTQNVDRLHEAAGSRRVMELHGNGREMVCMGCGEVSARRRFQERLDALNAEWAAPRRGEISELRPDGDADLREGVDLSGFSVPACQACGGVMKPAFVFFGANVPRPTVDKAMRHVLESSALLVVGSSLMTWSAYQYARAAHRHGIPVLIVNQGETRADDLATLKVEEPIGEVLSGLASELA